MSRLSVVYYSGGEIPHALQKYCLDLLIDSVSAAGGELICVTWEPLETSTPITRNIVWPRRFLSHENMYDQILAGISESSGDTIALAEHDVLYPSDYCAGMAQAGDTDLCYNTSIWCMNSRGFFPAMGCHHLSNCCGPRAALVKGIEGKLEESRARGFVDWAEPDGNGITLAHPTVDVRHGRNFTGDRESPNGYSSDIEYWGSASRYTSLFA